MARLVMRRSAGDFAGALAPFAFVAYAVYLLWFQFIFAPQRAIESVFHRSATLSEMYQVGFHPGWWFTPPMVGVLLCLAAAIVTITRNGRRAE